MNRFALMTLLSLAVVSGCGKKEDKSDKKNGDGGKKASERVIGTWVSNIEFNDAKLEQALKKQGKGKKKEMTSEEIDAGKKMMKTMLKDFQVQLEFKEDKSYTATISGLGPNPQVEKGTWEVVSEDGDTLKLKIIEGMDDTQNATLNFNGNDEFTYDTDKKEANELPINMPIVFKRKS